MRNTLLSALVLSLLLFAGMSSQGHAEQVAGLYDVEISVASQALEDRKAVARQALQTVFTRISGQPDVNQHPVIAEAISNASFYLKQFAYRQQATDDDEQLLLLLEFEPQLVTKLLRKAGLPIWSSNRPTVLVWLAVSDQQGRQLITGSTHPQAVAALEHHGERLGLALKRPLMDLEDSIALSAEQLWRFNKSALQAASARYQPNSILAGKVSRLSNGQLLGTWQFWFNQQYIEFDGEAENLDNYIGDALNQVASRQAKAYAIVPGTERAAGILVGISNVTSFADYAGVVRYLEGLTAVEHANVVSLAEDHLIIRLIAEGELSQLQRAIALDKRLQAQPLETLAVDAPIVLHYRWPK
jgi:hypothetical protein